jgi:hypothetical protein
VRRNTRFSAARGRVGVVVSRMPQHLRRDKARAKAGTAAIFVPLCRNAVLFTNLNPDLVQDVNSKDEKYQMKRRRKRIHNNSGRLVLLIRFAYKSRNSMEPKVRDHNIKEYLKGARGLRHVSGSTGPGQSEATNDLCSCHCVCYER